jgi:hypothetical protein
MRGYIYIVVKATLSSKSAVYNQGGIGIWSVAEPGKNIRVGH